MSSSVLQSAVREFLQEALRDRYRITGLFIDGVEVTQSIQYYSASEHLTDPSDRGPDNSIRLVADKPALVRVYVHHRPGTLAGVTGTVTVQKRRYGIWTDAGTLPKQSPASVDALESPDYAATRSWLGSTLNFLIPASVMRGQLRLRVEVNHAPSQVKAEHVLDVNAALHQQLRIRGIPVQYWGPNAAGVAVQLPAATVGDFERTSATTLRMFPVSQRPVVSLAGTFTWSQPLLGNIVNGACPQSWNNLLSWLGVARVLDGNREDSMYYAILPNGIPTGGAAGCGGGDAGVGAGALDDGMTMAHELGHVLGFAHGPCGLGAGDAGDPAYPAYEPYDTAANRMASIGEYGVDVSTRTIFTPNFARDFMSYCGPRWISLYNMRRLELNARLNPTWVSDGRDSLPPFVEEEWRRPSVFDRPDPPPPWVGRRVHLTTPVDVSPWIVVSGVILEERFEIRSVLRVSTRPVSGGRQVADTTVELLNANMAPLQRAPLMKLATQACGCGCGKNGGGGRHEDSQSGLVQAYLPDSPEGFTLRIVRKGEELWTRQSPGEPPVIVDVTAFVEGDSLFVRWQSRVADAFPTERAALWSNDDGQSWSALAVQLPEDMAQVPVASVTSGTILVRVVVSDGFNTTHSDPVAVDIPSRAPDAAILWPVEGSSVKTSEPVRLWGTATASDGSPLEGEALHWTLDGQRVGTGAEVWADIGDWEGEHKATLKAFDGTAWSSVSVVFNSSCTGRRGYREARQG